MTINFINYTSANQILMFLYWQRLRFLLPEPTSIVCSFILLFYDDLLVNKAGTAGRDVFSWLNNKWSNF